jgi:hypothetical protein
MYPSLLTNIDQTCRVSTAWDGRAMCYISVTPLKCEARWGMRNRFGLKSKVPLFTDQNRRKLPSLYRTGWEGHLWYFSHPAAVWCETGQRTVGASRVKFPSIVTNSEPNFPGCCAWIECQLWFFSLPSAARGEIGRKNCFGLRSKVLFFTDLIRPNSRCL